MAGTPQRCGICSGALVLRYPGSGGPPTAADLSPTCHATGAHGDLYACTRCGTVQQPVLPSGAELVDLYRAMRDDAYLTEEPGRRATGRRLVELVGAHGRRGRMLEVGCGHGLLLDEARALGWEVRGLEPADAGRAHAVETLGLDVRDATLGDLDPARDGDLDAIVLVDVIEHLDDPVGAVRRCRDLLAPDGVLLVVTPDPSSVTARVAGSRWWGYLPAHTYLLPRRRLRSLIEETGFALEADIGLKRTFTLGYWLGGLSERSPALGRLLGRRGGGRALARPVTFSLGDERVVLARRAVSVPAAGRAGVAGRAAGAPAGATP